MPRDRTPIPIALAQVPVHLADQLSSQGLIVPLGPADEALQRQAGLAKTIRNRFDIFMFDVRPGHRQRFWHVERLSDPGRF